MNASKFFIDTNVFLRAFVHDVPKQSREALRFLSQLSQGETDFYTANLVLAEFAWTLKSFYKVEKKKTVLALQSIIGLRNLKIIDHYDAEWGIDLYGSHSVKFIDALLASVPQIKSGEWTMISYDKDFDHLNCKRKTPADF